VSLSGAQGSRDEKEREISRLETSLSSVDLSVEYYRNRSDTLRDEVQNCLETLEEQNRLMKTILEQWSSMNRSLVEEDRHDQNMTELWEECLSSKGKLELLKDDTQKNLTVCLGDLGRTISANHSCRTLLGDVQKKEAGIIF